MALRHAAHYPIVEFEIRGPFNRASNYPRSTMRPLIDIFSRLAAVAAAALGCKATRSSFSFLRRGESSRPLVRSRALLFFLLYPRQPPLTIHLPVPIFTALFSGPVCALIYIYTATLSLLAKATADYFSSRLPPSRSLARSRLPAFLFSRSCMVQQPFHLIYPHPLLSLPLDPPSCNVRHTHKKKKRGTRAR